MSASKRLLLPLLAALSLVKTVDARKPAPLPAFSLTAADGKTVSSNQIHLPKHWLLIYVHQNSNYSVAVLNSLKGEKPDNLGQKMIVVVGGASAKDIQGMAKKYPHMALVTWYADPTRDAFRAMGLRGSPTVLGIEQDTVKWALVGTLPNREHLKSILKTWKDKDK